MPRRYKMSHRGTARHNATRDQRKKRFISVKNSLNGPYGHQGIYYTHHVHQEPMTWIDIYFPSKFHKGRYFSAALITLEMEAYDKIETEASDMGDAMYPNARLDLVFRKKPKLHPNHEPNSIVEFVRNDDYETKREFEEALKKELMVKPRLLKPYMKIDRDYWNPSIGLHAAVNTPSLTEEVIIKFIEQFRALGEPITHGLVWEGEEVEVVAQRLNEFNPHINSIDIDA